MIRRYQIIFFSNWRCMNLAAAKFMHLQFEKKMIWYLLIISVTFLGVFYFGVAADIMNSSGQQWKDCIADNTCIEQRL